MSKPKVAVAVSYFNNVREIPRLLDPIVKHVDMIIGVDGKYPLFDWPSNVSTDGSTELLREKYNATTYVFKEPVEQIDKRNKYLDIAEINGIDFVCVLDTDDYLHPAPINQRWDIFYDQISKIPDYEPLANVWFYISEKWEKNWNEVKDNKWQRYTRIVRPDMVRYDTVHWTFAYKDDPMIFAMPNNAAIDGCRFTADSTLRSKKYIKAGYKWAEKQMRQEDKRWDDPIVKRKRYNFWLKQIQIYLSIPGTKVTMDNTPDKVTEKFYRKAKSSGKV